MPKIPRFEENVAVGQTSISGPTNVSNEGLVGRSLQSLGGEVQQTAMQYGLYKNAKQKSDEAIFARKYALDTELTAQNFIKEIPNNPKIDFDGGVGGSPTNTGVVDLYDQEFKGLIENARSIPDGRRRQIALNAIQGTVAKYRKQAIDAEITLGNAAMFKNFERAEIDMGAAISNDPGRMKDLLDEQINLIDISPMDESNKKKYRESAESSAYASALLGFYDGTENGFENAKQFVQEGLKGKIPASKQLELLEKINNDQNTVERRNSWKAETQRKQDERERKAVQEQNMVRLFSQVTSEDPKIRTGAVEEARGLGAIGAVPKEFVTAMENRSLGLFKESSTEVVSRFTAEIVAAEKNPGKLRALQKRIIQAENDGLLHPTDTTRLLKDAAVGKGGSSKNPGAAAQRAAAKKFLDAAFAPSIAETASKGIVGKAEREQRRLEAERISADLQTRGMDPYSAVVEATRRSDPNNALLKNAIAAGPAQTPAQKLKATEKMQRDAQQYYKEIKSGKASPETKRKYLNTLQELKKQKDAAEHSMGIKDSLSRDKKLPEKRK